MLILGALTAFAPMSIDMYLPSLPTLERYFATDTASVQLTLAAFFIGLAVGQAFYGPLADRVGRKPPIYFGLVLYVLASAGCALAQNIESLIALRFVQAVTGCAGVVIARAVVRDLYDHHESARVFSVLMLVMGVAPILAPLLGGQILVWLGWRAIFWALALFGLACLVAVALALPETRPATNPEAGESDRKKGRATGEKSGNRQTGFARLFPQAGDKSLTSHSRTPFVLSALKDYWRLLIDRRFLGYTLAGGIAQAGMFAYISGSPFVFINIYGVPPQYYGWLFGANAFGLIAASQLNRRLLSRTTPDVVLKVANTVNAAFGVLLVTAAVTGIGGFAGILLPLFGYVATLGLIFPNAAAGALAPFPERAGSASALLGSMQFGIAALASAAVGSLHDGTALPMTAIIAACGLLAFVAYRWLVRKG
jgi:DHA1 family bicyclomycin/chloramphenicol resistance-like MFS transporter